MTHPSDTRWHQRLSNYEKAFSQLSKFMAQPSLNELEELGLIHCFNICLDRFKTRTLCQSFNSPTEDTINTILGQYLPEYNSLQIRLS